MRDKKKIIILLILALLFVAILLLLLHRCRDEPPKTTPATTESKPLDFISAEDSQNDKITIPGVTGLNFQSGQLNQTVNFYNPPSNNCYFVISLYLSDDTLIYQSDYLLPGEKITNIELLQELQNGLYRNCAMRYECFALSDNTQLNGTQTKIEIKSN